MAPYKTVAERKQEADLAQRRNQYVGAKVVERPVVEKPVQDKAAEWRLPTADNGPAGHVVVEIETGGEVVQGRKVNGVWRTVDSDQSVNINRWRYIGKERP